MILTDYSFNNQASLNVFKFHLLKTFVKSLKLAFLNDGIPLVKKKNIINGMINFLINKVHVHKF